MAKGGSYFDCVNREGFSEGGDIWKDTWVKWESKLCEDVKKENSKQREQGRLQKENKLEVFEE